jgi:hypothetical protein
MDGEVVALADEWRIGARIASGGFGQVYAASSSSVAVVYCRIAPAHSGD